MVTITSSPTAEITIPAKYVEDARRALVVDIAGCGDVLRQSSAEDRASSARILERQARLLTEAINAPAGDVTLAAENDNVSSPLVHMLEEMVRLNSEHLRDLAQYAPLPMGDVLDVAARLRWAAEEAVRIEPGLATKLREEETA